MRDEEERILLDKAVSVPKVSTWVFLVAVAWIALCGVALAVILKVGR